MVQLTLTEAAAKHPALSVQRLRQLCQQRRVQAEKRTARLWLINEQSLIEYLQSDRKPGPKSLTS